MSNSFTCKAIFGLGVTSTVDFVKLIMRYKSARDLGVAYCSANTTKYPKAANLVVFDGIRELFRFHQHILPTQVIVLSDVPTILKEISDCIPLDFTNNRSFEFNFNEINAHFVLMAMKSKKGKVISNFISYDNLGFHIDRVKNTGEFIASYIALTSNLPFDKRNKVKEAICKFLKAKKCSPDYVLKVVTSVTDGTNLSEEHKVFTKLFKEQALSYYKAINDDVLASVAAKKFNIDPYAVAFLRKLVRAYKIVEERMTTQNVVTA